MNETKEMTPFESTALAIDGQSNFIADLTSRAMAFTSMSADTAEERKALYTAMNNSDKRLGDCINMKLAIKDVYVEVVNCINSDTGEVTQCPRVVLIDKDGISYQCVSIGIFSALKKLFQVFGNPTWEEPIELIVKQITKKEKKMLTLEIA